MNTVKITVNSDRFFQRELEVELKKLDPKIKPEIIIRKALDAMQVTALVIASADLLVNVLNLIISIQKKNPDSTFSMKIESESKKLEINTDQRVNPKGIVESFFNNDEDD
ncbi:MAG: hypothetical protein KJ864_01105 [Candidatus Omnitrophica bacterium]|nr:hypothetical protein [Candidatus Omnitrophota bacterium]